MKKQILILLLFLMLLTACRAESLTDCVVIDKEYTPKWVQLMPIYNGKSFIYMPVVHSDRWTITIEGKGAESGEKHCQVVEVTQSEYDRYHIGDEYKQE